VATLRNKWTLGLVLAGALGCRDSRRELREWTPADHQPPPAVAPEGQGEEQAGDTARAVAALWAMRCASCHGESGQGNGPGRPPGAALPDFTQAAWQAQRTDAQLVQVITKGRNMMPAFGDEITEAGIDVLVQHIRSLSAAR
jgi:cytochrome c oxidase cbb3-type subunit 3